jgi:hypothetical protein
MSTLIYSWLANIRLEAHLQVIFFMLTFVCSWLANICLVTPVKTKF